MRIARALVGVLLFAVALSACGQEPAIPVDDAAMFERITAEGGQEYLREVSGAKWEDHGEAVGERLRWIEGAAHSPDSATAQRAGEAAQAIATFLGEKRDSLNELPAGLFGLNRRSIGELNPNLVQAYDSALSPFQGALVGDMDGVEGFGSADEPRSADLPLARDVFAVIDTDPQAGKAFTDAAYQRVREYLQAYGRGIITGKASDLVALRHAAELAGAVEGGQTASGNSEIETKSAQHWINWAGYEVAAALGVRPGDPGIPTRFFSPEGQLRTPDEVPPGELDAFATAVENFAFHHGAPTMGTDFDGWYETAAGK